LVTTLSITDASGQPISSAPMGTRLRFTISVTNRSNQSRTITLPNIPGYTLQVLDANHQAIYSVPESVLPAFTELPFAPGETHTYSEEWNQHTSGDAPTQVPAGTYRVLASIDGVPGDPGLRSAPVTLVIAPAANN
jgi:hypothetical protein